MNTKSLLICHIAKESLPFLEKLDEKLDEYEVNIDLFDDQKYESVG